MDREAASSFNEASKLSPEIQDTLRVHGVIRTYQAGQQVYGPGDAIQSLYLVDRGTFSFSRVSKAGNRSIFGFHGKGGSFGLYPMFLETPAIYECEASEAGQLTCISRQKLCELIDKDELVRWTIIESLCKRLKMTMRVLHDQRMLPLPQRLAWRLLEIANSDGAIMLSQSVLADYLSVSRFSIGKTLKEFESLGFIEIGYGKMKIANEEALREFGHR